MSPPKVAQKSLYVVDVEPHKYSWCGDKRPELNRFVTTHIQNLRI
jgi:hypothetical protein